MAIYPASISLEEAAGLARKHFRWFRKLMRPDMLHNWWTDQIAEHLEQFYHDLFRSSSWTGRASSALALATIEATTIRFAILACRVPLSKIELNKAKIGTKP